MASDDKLTAKKLHDKLLETFPGLNLSMSMVKRACMELGWTARKTQYGALVSESNQEKRVVWCNGRMETNDMDFDDVVFSDECTVELESHRRVTFYKKGQPQGSHQKKFEERHTHGRMHDIIYYYIVCQYFYTAVACMHDIQADVLESE